MLNSHKSSFILSVLAPGGQVQHHLLQASEDKVSLLGSQKLFPSIHALVTHLSIMKESLPCPLKMTKGFNDYMDEYEDDLIDIESEPEYEEIIKSLQKEMSW